MPQKTQIVIFTGKGGVGKSVLAASEALRRAKSGEKTLLVELGEHSSYRRLFNLSSNEFRPQKIDLVSGVFSGSFLSDLDSSEMGELWLARWSGDDCLKEYVAHMLKIDRLASLFFENKAMKAFINAAPALHDVAILGKLTSGIRDVGPPLEFDSIVVDAHASGHFLAMMRAPMGLAEAIQVGPMGTHCREIEKVLTNSKICKFFIVTLPEELPVVETLELSQSLKSEWNIQPEIICNQVWQRPKDLAEYKPTSEIEKRFYEELQRRLSEQSKYIDQLRIKSEDSELSQPPVLVPRYFIDAEATLVEKMSQRLKNV